MGKLINIDNGGTLTDIWILDGERSYHTKTITTPYDLSKCFHEGLKKVSGMIYGEEDLATLLQSTDHIRYSTTQGTNALVERKGPRLGLVTGEQLSLERFCDNADKQQLFAALVGDRVATLDSKLDEQRYRDALVEAINRLSAAGSNRIVVVFGEHDYQAEEARFRRASLELFPRHLLGAVPILYAGNLSSDQDPIRRGWTAINNAFLHPAMERFLYNAENKLREYRTRNPLLIYRNDGYAGRVAKTVALKTYSSGPRAGMDSARAYADYYDFDKLITMDVGGTTTDIGLVEKGKVKASGYGEVEGIECSFPLCDIVSIGLGGGSIFRVNNGEISVGPDSVGGAPGPACFGMGGKQATITDALLLMGLLDPKTYFGGEMSLDVERARAAVATNVADPLGIAVEAAIHAMLKAWAGEIAAGLAKYTQLSPDTVLSAFGGGGPMAVLAVAEAAGIKTVIVPGLAAVFSAHGIGFSDIAHMAELKLAANNSDELSQAFASLRQKVRRDMFSEGFQLQHCQLESWLKINDETVSVDVDAAVLPGSVDPGDEVILGLRAVKAVNRAELPHKTQPESHPGRVDSQRKLLNADGSTQDMPIYRVEDQSPGAAGVGPAVIEQDFWTCKVLPGWSFEFTCNGDVLFNRIK